MGAPMLASAATHNNQGSLRTMPSNHDTADEHLTKDTDLSNLEATYTSLIQQHLSLFLFENAIFLAERLVASVPSHASYYLLALCFYKSGALARAQAILQNVASHCNPKMSYLLGQCLYEAGQYTQAEQVLLEPCRLQWSKQQQQKATNYTADAPTDMDEWILSTTPCPIPNGAAGLSLLGNICRKSHRKERAISYFKMSLKLDPTIFTSYMALCEENCIDMEPTAVFGVVPSVLMQQQDQDESNVESSTTTPPPYVLSQTPVNETALQPMDIGTPSSASFLHQKSLFQTTGSKKQQSLGKRHSASSSARPPMMQPPSLFETPNLTPIPKSNDEDDAGKPKAWTGGSTSFQVARAKHVASRLYYEPSPEMTPNKSNTRFLGGMDATIHNNSSMGQSRLFQYSDVSPAATRTLRESSTTKTQRKPRKLFPPPSSNKNKNGGEGTSNNTQRSVARNVAMSNVEQSRNEEGKTAKENGVIQEETHGVEEILELLCVLGTAYRQLCQYNCREALQTFHALSSEQFHTGWVLHHVGRAYFEIADYANAKRTLEHMQHVEPHRMEGLEVLSTVLWHLKKEVELSHLAQGAVDFDRMSPEAWVVVGNCFSLQKEHETALTFFRRSIQLDPRFTYAHTLSGHEYVSNEDFDKAVACYRDAIRVDERHYNAWYGLGSIYYRQEKYDLAEYHFRRAILINPQSCVLHCHLGMAQHANGLPYEALDTLAEAFRLDPRNAQARYQRATIYMSLERPHEALAELKKVRDAAPRESSVHFAMGRVLKRIGRPEQAMRCFLTAMDLDPKDNNLVKSAMDKLDEPDVDEEVSAF